MSFLVGFWLSLVAVVLLAVISVSVYFIADAFQSQLRGCRLRKAPWRHDDLHVDMDDWQLWDVQWRQVDGRVEVAYSVANWLPGQHEYRNDFIRVFQRGVGLEERGVRVSRVLLKGAETRFMQVFDARDGSMPVIQVDSSYAAGEEDGA